MYLTSKLSSGNVLYQGFYPVLIVQVFLAWHCRHLSEPGELPSQTSRLVVILCMVYTRWLILYFLPQFVPSLVYVSLQGTPYGLSRHFLHPLFQSTQIWTFLFHNNPSSATWSVCRRGGQNLWFIENTMLFCSYRRKKLSEIWAQSFCPSLAKGPHQVIPETGFIKEFGYVVGLLFNTW